MSRAALVVGLAVLWAGVAGAQTTVPPRISFTDAAPRVVGDRVLTDAVGAPDERVGRFSARRAGARARGRERAVRALHRWADEALARVGAPAPAATAVHAALARSARVEAVRPLVDAGAVVRVSVVLEALRSAYRHEGLPWAE